MAYLALYPEAMQGYSPTGAMYEVHIYGAEIQSKGLFEVFVGMEGSFQSIRAVPVELTVKVLPATRYAIFTFSGEQITTDCEKVVQGGLASSNYRRAYAYSFQYYDSRFKGMDHLMESSVDLYVPVEEAT
jgi:predicted transcriptional regulator YdeE